MAVRAVKDWHLLLSPACWPHALYRLCPVRDVCGRPLSEVWAPGGEWRGAGLPSCCLALPWPGLRSLSVPRSADLGAIAPTCPST